MLVERGDAGVGEGGVARGGAGTEVVAVTVFNFLTARGDIGAASAQALVLALILGLFVGIYVRFFAKKEEVS